MEQKPVVQGVTDAKVQLFLEESDELAFVFHNQVGTGTRGHHGLSNTSCSSEYKFWWYCVVVFGAASLKNCYQSSGLRSFSILVFGEG